MTWLDHFFVSMFSLATGWAVARFGYASWLKRSLEMMNHHLRCEFANLQRRVQVLEENERRLELERATLRRVLEQVITDLERSRR